MKSALLPKLFIPHPPDDLIRLGKNYDGGYLVCLQDVVDSDCLLAIGINFDWSFEKDFSKLNDCLIHAYDGSLNKRFFLFKMITSLLRFKFIRALKVFDFWRMFRKQNSFFDVSIGVELNKNQISLSSAVLRLKALGFKKCFLKIDIESWEYRVLNEIILHKSFFTGIALEFHNCDLHQNRIENFIKHIEKHIAHLHVNNFGQTDQSNFPILLEMSFSSHSMGKAQPSLPLPVDQPNNPHVEDYKVEFY
jgi:hypothetical protein